jgi:hypothetical protein
VAVQHGHARGGLHRLPKLRALEDPPQGRLSSSARADGKVPKIAAFRLISGLVAELLRRVRIVCTAVTPRHGVTDSIQLTSRVGVGCM